MEILERGLVVVYLRFREGIFFVFVRFGFFFTLFLVVESCCFLVWVWRGIFGWKGVR